MSRARFLLRDARSRARLSQRQLAKLAGAPQSTVARIETGALEPRIDTLERLLHAAGRELESAARAGQAVDRTQIRELLRLTPTARLRTAVADAHALSRFDSSTRWRK